MKNRKGDNLTINKLIIIILVILVILAILMFVFKVDILEWLRNLPGYSYEEDKEIEAPEEGEVISEEYFKVATLLNGKNIKFCVNGNCNNLKESKLKIKGSATRGEIEVAQLWDDTIGGINNGKVEIYSEILKKEGELYKEVEKDLPEHKYVLNLNGSVYFSGIFYRDKEILEQK